MFDYAPVNAGLALLGAVCITLTCLLPRRKGSTAINEAIDIGDNVMEAKVPPSSPLVGQSPQQVEALAEDGMKLSTA